MTESQLKGQLAEYLNAEIVLLTISNITAAMEWLRQSFLYVRVSSETSMSCCNSQTLNWANKGIQGAPNLLTTEGAIQFRPHLPSHL